MIPREEIMERLRSPLLDFAFVLFGLLLPPASSSTPCVDYADHLRMISLGDPDLPLSSGYHGVATMGDFAYVAAYDDLVVYDVSNPSEPEILETISLMDLQLRPTTGIVLQGSLLYVTQGFQFGTGRVALLSLQNPSNPSVIGAVETPTTALDVAANDKFAYVACADGRFEILDVRPPQTAFLVSTVSTGGGDVKGIALLDGTLHVAAGTNGLRSYSLSNPTAPVLLDTWLPPAGDRAVDVSHDGDLTKLLLLVIHDDPSFPSEGRVEVLDATVPSNLLKRGGAPLWIDIYDVSEPSTPVLVNQIPQLGLWNAKQPPSPAEKYSSKSKTISSSRRPSVRGARWNHR
jgi:hypothetical protein